MGKRRRNKNKFSGVINSNPIICSFKRFKNRSLYKVINTYGYKIFTLSSVTIDLINNYGPENIPTKLRNAGINLPDVVKDVDFKNDGSTIYDKTRKAATFYRIDHLKIVDSELYNIVICITNELMEIRDLSKWSKNEDSDIWKECLNITLNFLISIPYKSKIKIKNGIQGFHSDYPIIKKTNNDGTLNEYFESNYPLSVIIALQNDSHFRFLCNSHNQYNENGEPNATSYYSKLLTLQQGQLIIFHPNLIHSGWKYDKKNIRIHFYFDNYKVFERFPDLGKTLNTHFNGIEEKIINSEEALIKLSQITKQIKKPKVFSFNK